MLVNDIADTSLPVPPLVSQEIEGGKSPEIMLDLDLNDLKVTRGRVKWNPVSIRSLITAVVDSQPVHSISIGELIC